MIVHRLINWNWTYDETTGVDTVTIQNGFNFTWNDTVDNPAGEQVYLLKFQSLGSTPERGIIPNMYHNGYPYTVKLEHQGNVHYDICQSVTNHEINQVVPQMLWAAWSVGLEGSNSDIEFNHMDFTRIDEGLTLAIKRPGNIIVNTLI